CKADRLPAASRRAPGARESGASSRSLETPAAAPYPEIAAPRAKAFAQVARVSKPSFFWVKSDAAPAARRFLLGLPAFCRSRSPDTLSRSCCSEIDATD